MDRTVTIEAVLNFSTIFSRYCSFDSLLTRRNISNLDIILFMIFTISFLYSNTPPTHLQIKHTPPTTSGKVNTPVWFGPPTYNLHPYENIPENRSQYVCYEARSTIVHTASGLFFFFFLLLLLFTLRYFDFSFIFYLILILW